MNISVAQASHISALFPYLSDAFEVRLSRTASKLFHDRIVLNDYYDEGTLDHGDVEQLKKSVVSEEAEVLRDQRSRHLASLVDGGYFDNTGLVPTQEAINFISDKRLEEAGRQHAVRRPYKNTNVVIVHFSNDPSYACLPLENGWADKLDRRAKEYFDPSTMAVGCSEDATTIQRSASERVLNWIQAPINGLLTVRDSHALYERQSLTYRFSNAFKETTFVSLDLATAMTEALARPFSYSALNPMYPSSLFDVTPEMIETIESETRKEADAFFAGNSANVAEKSAYFDRFSNWQRRNRDWTHRLGCVHELSKVDPPLGWTLNGHDKSALQCLSQLALFRNGIVSASEPYNTEPPEWQVDVSDRSGQPPYQAVFRESLAALVADAVDPTEVQIEAAEQAQRSRRPEGTSSR
jgi:hypothetical protein